MLVHIAIKNLAIVKQVELTVSKGLTAITGETGAGKSIALDALDLCLGARAESNMVRQGAEKAEVIAHFDISRLPTIQQLLTHNELQQDDNPDECFIRRVINSEGRSKAFINGVPVNLSQLKEIAGGLALIHSQHAHHQYLKPDFQRQLLDKYAQHHELLQQTEQCCQAYAASKKQLDELLSEQQQRKDRCSLLAYQVQELDDFSLAENEFVELETEFKKLSNVQELTQNVEQTLHSLKLDEHNNILQQVQQCLNSLEQSTNYDSNLSTIFEALQSAQISMQEAADDLDHYHQQLESDPAHAQEVEKRYAQCMDLARKHQIQPEQLYEFHMQMADEYQTLQKQEQSLDALKTMVDEKLAQYYEVAEQLHNSRTKAATKLADEIQSSIREMNLPHALVQLRVCSNENKTPSPLGNDSVEIMLSVNPGQALESMEKVVSGGELSRIGLALQVISSKDNHIPTMVFDEVDTGISGPTAALIGKMLRQLGSTSQVICITHLPQVAAQAHHQLFVNKSTDGKTTETQLLALSKQDRVNEIARLLAGDELTDTAIANAKDLLQY